MPVTKEFAKAIYWIVNETCGLKKGNYKELLYTEFVELSKTRGNAIKKRIKVQELAEKNKTTITVKK